MSKFMWGAAGIAGVLLLGLGIQVTSTQYIATKVAQQTGTGPSETQQPRGQVASAPAKQKVLVAFKELPGPAERALVENHGGSVRFSYHLVNAIAAELPEPAIEALKRDTRVAAVELDAEVPIVDAELDSAWGVKAVGAGTVHDSGNKGTGIKIAILDTGIDYNHPDLKDNYAGGYDFYNNDSDPMDDHSHGTHIAGTIAALDNDIGVVGMAPEARIYALKTAGSDGTARSSTILAGIEWAVDNGIQVTNNSYGTTFDLGSTMKAAYDNASKAGVLMIAAAGNSGSGSDTVNYPAKYDSVVAVAALANATSRASYSSTGPAVEVAAPGSSVRSTMPGGGYGSKSGTSMASPHVVGLSALMMRAGITTPAAIRQALASTAVDLGAAGKDNEYGYGRIDAPAAVAAGGTINFDPTVAIVQPPNNSIFNSGAAITFSGTASDQEDGNLSSSLVWTSSISGQIGTGSTVTSSSLGDGTHIITATATDSGGRTGSATVTVTISTTTPDTTPPTAPAGLTASEKIKGKNISIDLTWAAATDNIAVTKYQILRNGTQIAESTSTNYSDRSAQKGNTYVYAVRAVDAAGNMSPNSNEATVSLIGDDGGGGGGGGGGKPKR